MVLNDENDAGGRHFFHFIKKNSGNFRSGERVFHFIKKIPEISDFPNLLIGKRVNIM